MNEETQIHLEQQGDLVVFEIQKDVTSFSEPVFSQVYGQATDQGAKQIILSFMEDAYINSGGIAVLIQLLAKSQKNRQVVSITGLSAHFEKIFNMVGITKFAQICATIEEAMAGMKD